MWIKAFALLTVLVFLRPTQTSELDSQVWNWAWNRETGELFAYSETGDINTLCSDLTGWVDGFWRVSNHEAVGIIPNSASVSLSLINEQSIEPLTLDFDAAQLERFIEDGEGLTLATYANSFMVLTTRKPINKTSFRPAILIDLRAKQIELLSEATLPIYRMRLDDELLRYVHVSELDGLNTIELRERTLHDGKEHILYETSGVWVDDSDRGGDRWLIRTQDLDNTDSLQYRLLDVRDGTEDVIYTRDPETYYKRYLFSGDDLIAYSPVCEAACKAELLTIDGDLLTYPLPDTPSGSSIYSFYRSRDQILTIGRLYDYWHLRVDVPPEFVGYRYQGGSHLPSTSSPDNRFVLLADTQDYPQSQRRLMDMETLEAIVTLPEEIQNSVYMMYLNEGFIINTLESGSRLMYRYADESITELPDIGNGEYFDILPDGDVLYSVVTDYSKSQLVRYSPQTDETRLLIEDVLHVAAVDAQP